MMEFDNDWFFTGPIDYEFKMYTLLARLKRLQAMLKRFVIWPVIEDVENELDNLYRFKYEKETLDDRLKVAKDIDFINFQIIYELPEQSMNEHMEILHRVANDAIIQYEDVYMDARFAWRDIEKQMILSWVPEKIPILNHGYVAVIENKQRMYVCRWQKPSKLTGDWRTFKFEKIEELDYTDVTDLSKVRAKYIGLDSNELFCRVDYPMAVPFDETAFYITKSIVYSSLMKDFTS